MLYIHRISQVASNGLTADTETSVIYTWNITGSSNGLKSEQRQVLYMHGISQVAANGLKSDTDTSVIYAWNITGSSERVKVGYRDKCYIFMEYHR